MSLYQTLKRKLEQDYPPASNQIDVITMAQQIQGNLSKLEQSNFLKRLDKICSSGVIKTPIFNKELTDKKLISTLDSSNIFISRDQPYQDIQADKGSLIASKRRNQDKSHERSTSSLFNDTRKQKTSTQINEEEITFSDLSGSLMIDIGAQKVQYSKG